MQYKADDIFTPQGILNEVEKNPNLDFLMNIFHIPRAFGVSGFGSGWNVGQHSAATAILALFWGKFNNYSETVTNRLVTMALTHDLHEAVTGDILPMFKSRTVRQRLDEIQQNILSALGVKQDEKLESDLKIIDLIAFLYEIKQVSPSILSPKKLQLAKIIAEKQREVLYTYCQEKNIPKKKIQEFLKKMEI